MVDVAVPNWPADNESNDREPPRQDENAILSK